MKVIIPSRQEHEGMYDMEVNIRDYCPKCGEKRGELYKGLSYDGSRRLNVSCWKNPCGHTDMYSEVRKEYSRKINFKHRRRGKPNC